MEDKSAAEQIDVIIKMPGDWRGETLSRLRALIKQADSDAVEEVKWKKPSSKAAALGIVSWAKEPAGLMRSCYGMG
jgi:hypothetical protein